MMVKNQVSFYTRLNLPVACPTHSGNRFRTDFVDSFDEDGVALVKPSGKTDLQEDINKYYREVDLYSILSRILPNVDARDLSSISVQELLSTYFSNYKSVPGVFADVTSLPKNIHEVNKGYVKMVEFFNRLPSDVRLKYHNSVDEFVAGYDGFVADVKKAQADLVAQASKGQSESNFKEGDSNV